MVITPKTCSVDGCEREHYGLGYCSAHYQQFKDIGYTKPIRQFRTGRICKFEDCGRPVAGPEYCQTHQKAFNNGQELKPIRTKRKYFAEDTCIINWCNNKQHANNYCKKHHHLAKFGISEEKVNALFPNANTPCEICGKVPNANERGLHVDHDHLHCDIGCEECIRGVLCKNCNHALGFFQDRIDVLETAIEYLRR